MRQTNGKTYNYCVLSEQRMCTSGSFTSGTCSGKPSDSCPYGSTKGCSGSVFNYSTSFCYDGSVYYKCSGMEYNPTTHICQGYAATPAKCGSSNYNPLEKSCCDGIETYSLNNQRCQSNVVETKCGTGSYYYDPPKQFCNGGSVYSKCDGKEYEPSNQRCYNSVVETKCGTGSYYYNPATQFCNGSNVYSKCDGKEWNPENQRCYSNVIEMMCGSDWYNVANTNLRCENSVIQAECGSNWYSNWYNVSTQFCDGNQVLNKCGTATYNPSTQYCNNGSAVKDYGSLSYSGQTYKTVVIGSQIWMAENLNHNAAGSECYDNQESNCKIYGRLYDWSTAMALPSSCDTTGCSNQITTPHQGICPSSWHIPNNAEWSTLVSYVEGENSCSNCTAKHLKAVSGWNNGCSPSGSGNSLCEDTYGFSALPGGRRVSNFSSYVPGIFHIAGYSGVWWNSTELYRYDANQWSMFMEQDHVSWDLIPKTYYNSVRCLED